MVMYIYSSFYKSANQMSVFFSFPHLTRWLANFGILELPAEEGKS